MKMTSYKVGVKHKLGFTIVELLVVIVVIGILSAITIISYRNISNRANIASLQSDLTSASKKLKNYGADNSQYPTAIDCSATPAADTICLTPSNGATFDYTANNTTTPPTFYLKITKGDLIYYITESVGPLPLVAVSWAQVASEVGAANACAVSIDNVAYCWGNNNSGQLGDGTITGSTTPVAVKMVGPLSGKSVSYIGAGQDYSCALASDNQVYCWGNNGDGRLGNGGADNSLTPVAVDTSGVLNGKTIKSLSMFSQHACVIASNDKAYCWGSNNSGQLGNNTLVSSSVPVAVDTSGVLSGKTIKSIAIGGSHTCAIASDDEVYCWGYNGSGQLGNGSIIDSLVPVAVNIAGVLNGKTVKAITAGDGQTCAIASDDRAYCWGSNSTYQLGNNSTVNSSVPVAVDTSGVLSGKTIKSIATGSEHTCVTSSDSGIFCWGSNYFGQLGNETTTDSSVPIAANISRLYGRPVQSITAGYASNFVITNDGKMFSWGYNGFGQLGNGGTSNALKPSSIVTIYP